jgi:Tfp pilus assembly protein PilN
MERRDAMKRLHLDLAPFSLRRELYRIPPAARALALAGLLLCVVAGFRAQKLLVRLDSLDSQAAQLAARAERFARSSMTLKSEPIDAKQGAAVNAAVARLNLPWNDILNAVEAATPSQVALLSITPEPGRELLRIEAECNDSKAMIDYLKALEQQPLFGRVNLVKHELVKDGTDGVIRFHIEAQWRGAGS